MLKSTKIRYILLVVHTLSLVMLAFGLVKNLIEIDISAHLVIDFKLFNEKRSVLSTLTSLWQSGNYWPYALILIFGMVVPVIKSGIIYYLLLAKNPAPFWTRLVSAMGKWAMADVFAISIFIAFLGAKAMENTSAILHEGFYWFSGYVLVSAVVGMVAVKTAE